MSVPDSRTRTHRPATLLLLSLLAAGLVSCAPSDPRLPTQSAEPSYDIAPLLEPDRKYLGVALGGSLQDTEAVTDFTEQGRKEPNLREYYAKWGDPFHSKQNRTVWDSGQLPFLVWEPFSVSPAAIAAGRDDTYIRDFARAVRAYNRPLALSFGHEMNGDWYPWGNSHWTAAEFARSWRHIHDLFIDEGAANVIWAWTPNVINPAPDVRLKPYYPGDAYVDWIGIVGYYASGGPETFATLFGPTMEEIDRFTTKPVLIAETAVQAGERKPAAVTDLFEGVSGHDRVIGLVWFNVDKEADWRINSGPASLAAFQEAVSGREFGFDVRKP